MKEQLKNKPGKPPGGPGRRIRRVRPGSRDSKPAVRRQPLDPDHWDNLFVAR